MWPAAIGSDVAIASAATIGLGVAMGSDAAIGSDIAVGSNRERSRHADVNRIFFSAFVSEKGGQPEGSMLLRQRVMHRFAVCQRGHKNLTGRN